MRVRVSVCACAIRVNDIVLNASGRERDKQSPIIVEDGDLTHTNTYTHTYTHSLTHTHVHTHTYIHTHTQVFRLLSAPCTDQRVFSFSSW